MLLLLLLLLLLPLIHWGIIVCYTYHLEEVVNRVACAVLSTAD
jgi:hypothetical protein